MRKYLYLFAMVMSTMLVFAQESETSSFRISNFTDTTITYKNGDTIVVDVLSLDKSLENALIKIKNVSSQDVNTTMRQRVLNRIEGASYSFCFGNCVEDNGKEVLEGEGSVLIKAGQYTEDLCVIDYNPNGQAGTSYVRYTVYNADSTNDSSCIVVKYNDKQTNINESERTTALRLSVYPNPVTTSARIHVNGCNFNQPELRICNLLGSVIYQQKITSAEQYISIDVSNWNNGVYFYSICSESKTICTQKMIVAH